MAFSSSRLLLLTTYAAMGNRFHKCSGLYIVLENAARQFD
jgi:hypothetical protein